MTGSKPSRYRLAVVVPMHNEEVGAERCLVELHRELKKAKYPWHIFVTNDGSTDRTKAILSKASKKFSKTLTVLHHAQNQGYGAGLKTGMDAARKAKYDYAVCIDSDLTNPPRYIHQFAALMDGTIDCVKASRYIDGGGMEGVPFKRQAMSWLGNQVARVCFRIGVNDCTNGFRMLKLSTIKNLHYTERGFGSIMEELLYLKQQHARFKELPNILLSRTDTKTHFQYNWKTIWSYLKYSLKAIWIV